MGKGIIKFNLPEEQEDFENALIANKAFSVFWEFDQFLRSEYKYNDNEAAYDIRDKFREMLTESGIDIDGGIAKKVKKQPWWKRLI